MVVDLPGFDRNGNMSSENKEATRVQKVYWFSQQQFQKGTISMECKFTGKVLTWADLEKAIGNDTIIDGVRASWDYFGFDRKHEWKAVLAGDETILVTDENRDLNMAGVYPDMDTFILWLDMVNDDRVKEDEKERLFREQHEQQLELATA